MTEKRETVIESFDSARTRALGRSFGKTAEPGLVIALSGDLGAGKTVFAKGFAEGLGITSPVTSPTFTLLQVYEGGRLPLCHMDAYRLEEEEELEAVGGHEYFGAPWVSLVEWPENVAGLLPPDTLWIRIARDLKKGPDYRKITVSGEVPHDDTGN